jgi:hypothetical protein
MHFSTKSYLKNTHNHTAKQAFRTSSINLSCACGQYDWFKNKAEVSSTVKY